MPSIPNNLSLETIANGAEIKAQPLRDNYTEIQTEFNKVVAILDGGTVGQFLKKDGASSAAWADVPVSVPTGALCPYAGSSAPSGWLLCDGAAVSRTTYADLFSVIGTTYGTGDGSTTFNLPDLRGRVVSGLGTNADVNALGNNEGLSLSQRSGGRHWHDVRRSANASIVNYGSTGGSGSVIGDNFFQHPATGFLYAGALNDDASNRSRNVVPYLTLNYIIKT